MLNDASRMQSRKQTKILKQNKTKKTLYGINDQVGKRKKRHARGLKDTKETHQPVTMCGP